MSRVFFKATKIRNHTSTLTLFDLVWGHYAIFRQLNFINLVCIQRNFAYFLYAELIAKLEEVTVPIE